MKKVFGIYIGLLCIFSSSVFSLDTLRLFPGGSDLELRKYAESDRWGYVAGHNYAYRQQFAQKYFHSGVAFIDEIEFSLGGVFANPKNRIEVAVFQVRPDGLPGNKLGGREIFYEDLELNGGLTRVALPTKVQISDSFFVSVNFKDYAHGGYEGDTLGVKSCLEGCRDSLDLSVFGRIAVQRHKHGDIDWRDFFTQNSTPFRIYLAIYPLLEKDPTSVSLAGHQGISSKGAFPAPQNLAVYLSQPAFRLKHLPNLLIGRETPEFNDFRNRQALRAGQRLQGGNSHP